MSNPLKGPCPHCGAEIYIRVTVSKIQVSQPPAAEQATPRWQPPTRRDGPPLIEPTNGNRPTCEDCGATGAILEQTVKKPGKNQGRMFSAYTCPNEGCDSFGDIIADTFRFLDGRKQAARA